MSKRTGNVDSAGTLNGDGGMMLWGPAWTAQWRGRCGAGKGFTPLANPPLMILHAVTLGCLVWEMVKWPNFPRYAVSQQYLVSLRHLELALRNIGLQNYHLWKSRPLNLIWTIRNQRQGSIYVGECVVAWKLQIKIIHPFMCKSPSLWYTNWKAVWFPCSFHKQAACDCTL